MNNPDVTINDPDEAINNSDEAMNDFSEPDMPSRATTVLAELEALGTAQNRKVYARHGVDQPMFGVSFANLRKLAKRLRYDHSLARALWASGNHDARVLALSVAEPAAVDRAEIEAWAADLANYVLIDEFAAFVASTPYLDTLADDWTERDGEWIVSAGWTLVARQALDDGDLPDSYFGERLRTIESRIAGAANRVRHCMNGTLIAIGGRNETLRRHATAAAGHIGPVVVDHGETSCKTPEAVAYIDRIWARRTKKSA